MVRGEEWKLKSIEIFAPSRPSEWSRDPHGLFVIEEAFYFETVRAKAQCGSNSRMKCVLVFGEIFDSREMPSRKITIRRKYQHEFFAQPDENLVTRFTK
jgi:hypothetical protein